MHDKEGHLTDEEFWDEFWAPVDIPAKLDLTDPGTRSLAREIDRVVTKALPSPRGKSKSLVEIGCAPGRWLEHFASLGFSVAGIESAPKAAELTRENLHSLEVEANIYQLDALDLPSKAPDLAHSFDCVISLGLIEHFEDPQPMLAIHKWLARPGGLTVIGVPNYSGLSGRLQKRLDRTWLEHHNTTVMSPTALRTAGAKAGLRPLSSTYAGGFDPNLYNWRGRSLLGFIVTRTGKLLRKIPGTDYLQSRHWSSYIVASFEAPTDAA
jgi:SAM-dependent methyltransferase